MTPRQDNGLPLNAKTPPVLETQTATEAMSTRRGVAMWAGYRCPPGIAPPAATQEVCP